ncbi:hypothetical protein ACFYZJ_03365 [Streptomyces sp. NPDC001848]|uniref:hypothetical protein n=1 Tax=Streptomyces sp. NPDC001848 TaxID=3364618 RepID=UPI0036C5D3E4
MVSSSKHGTSWTEARMGDLDNLNGERHYRLHLAYARSKRANVYSSAQLHRWATAEGLPLRGVIAIPGLTDTGELTKASQHGRRWRAVVPPVIALPAKEPIKGARPSLYVATVPDLPGGSYLAPSGPPPRCGAHRRRAMVTRRSTPRRPRRRCGRCPST